MFFFWDKIYKLCLKKTNLRKFANKHTEYNFIFHIIIVLKHFTFSNCFSQISKLNVNCCLYCYRWSGVAYWPEFWSWSQSSLLRARSGKRMREKFWSEVREAQKIIKVISIVFRCKFELFGYLDVYKGINYKGALQSKGLLLVLV